MKFKKIVVLFCCLFIVIGSLAVISGCQKKGADHVVTINFAGRDYSKLLDRLKQEFPDISFEIKTYWGNNPSSYLRQTLINDDASDIFFYTQKLDDSEAKQYLLNLSGYDFVSRYDTATRNAFVVDGALYQLPGPVSVRSMAYNRTLFERHGWQMPTTHSELVALCKQIRNETDDITPIAMSLGGLGYPFTLVTTLSQAGFFTTPKGLETERAYLKGEASVGECFGEGLDMAGELIDAGAYNAAMYKGVWDGPAIDLEFANGKAAMMCLWAGQQRMATLSENSEDEYILFPFYGKDEGEEFLGIATSTTWGVAKRVGESGNEQKLSDVMRVMNWLSTAEAQTYMQTNNTEIPTIKNVQNDTTVAYYKDLWDLSESGQKAFMIYSGYEDIIVEGGQIIQDAMLAGTSEGMKDKFITECDKLHKAELEKETVANSYGTIAENLTEAQTVQLMADVLLDAKLGDFVLLTMGGVSDNYVRNRTGVSGKLYAGELNSTVYNIVRPGAGGGKVEVVQLTGAQVKDLLKNGKTIKDEEIFQDGRTATWQYFWAGIDVKFNKKNEITSVKLNGKELADDAVYSVVFSGGDYSEEIAGSATITDTDKPILDIWVEYLSKNSPVHAHEPSRK